MKERNDSKKKKNAYWSKIKTQQGKTPNSATPHLASGTQDGTIWTRTASDSSAHLALLPLSWAGCAPMSADFSHQICCLQHPGASAAVFVFTSRPVCDDLSRYKESDSATIEWLRQLSGTLAKLYDTPPLLLHLSYLQKQYHTEDMVKFCLQVEMYLVPWPSQNIFLGSHCGAENPPAVTFSISALCSHNLEP